MDTPAFNTSLFVPRHWHQSHQADRSPRPCPSPYVTRTAHVRPCTPLLLAPSASSPSDPDPQPSAPRVPDPLLSNPLGAPKVICFGETISDCFSTKPDADPSDPSAWDSFSGGCPANVAAVLTALGTPCAMIGNVGDDETGTALRAALQARGVNVDGILSVPGAATRRVFVRTMAGGERVFAGYGGGNEDFADARAVDVDRMPGVLFYAASVLVTGTMGLAFKGSAAALQEIVSLAALCKLSVIVDINWRPGIWVGWRDDDARAAIQAFLCSPDITVVKGSVDDIAFVFGEEVARGALERPADVLDVLGGRARGVLITAGEHGAAYAFRDAGTGAMVEGRVDAEPPESAVVDTTGAGDAFVAGFVAAAVELGGEGAFSDKDKAAAMVRTAVKTASFVLQAIGPTESLPSAGDAETIRKAFL